MTPIVTFGMRVRMTFIDSLQRQHDRHDYGFLRARSLRPDPQGPNHPINALDVCRAHAFVHPFLQTVLPRGGGGIDFI